MSVHTPHPHAVEALAASMHRFDAAIRTQPGVREANVFKTEDGRLIGLILWASRDAFERGRAAGREAVKDDPFDEWEAEPVSVYVAESV
jgi:heme-degrading monooxygenase HmoA